MAAFDAVAYLSSQVSQQTKPGLERITALLDELGAPQHQLRCVHVAGTNGKGSVCAYLSGILSCAGFKVGAFSSPAFDRFEDAISIEGTPISDDALSRCAERVRNAACRAGVYLHDEPTSFELTCATAFLYFAQEACDICVIETGLGGRLDATNVVIPDVCVITRIGFDHVEYLGNTLGEIAAHKAGIIKRGARVVTWPQTHEVMSIIEAMCESQDCPLTHPDVTRLVIQPLSRSLAARSFFYKGQKYETRMVGAYQPENAAVALEAAYALRRCGMNLPDAALRQGIAQAHCPARFEVVHADPLMIVDGAHNYQGMQALVVSLKEVLQAREDDSDSKHICFIMGVLADKHYEAMIEPLVPFASACIAYAPDNPRALSAADLAEAIEHQVDARVTIEQASSAKKAAERAIEMARDSGCIVVACGSLYSAAAIRRVMLSA